MTPAGGVTEEQIWDLVRRFYDLALADETLGPLFRGSIPNLEEHLAIVQNFWSHALLGTKRYYGTAYPAHARLIVEEDHFTRWMEAFSRAATETLPPAAAEQTLRRARQMMQGFRMGLRPLKDPPRGPAALRSAQR